MFQQNLTPMYTHLSDGGQISHITHPVLLKSLKHMAKPLNAFFDQDMLVLSSIKYWKVALDSWFSFKLYLLFDRTFLKI